MKSFITLLAAVAGIGVMACGPSYDHTEFTDSISGDLSAKLSVERLEIPEGGILKVHVASFNDKKEAMTNYVSSNEPATVEVVSVITDHDFAFLGVKVGTTTIEFKANDDIVLVVQAVVTAQAPAE